MKKKIIAIALLFVLLLPTVFTGCSNGDDLTIYPVLSAKNAKPGDTVTVEIYIDNGERFCSMDFYLSYDSEYVEFVDSEAAAIADMLCEITSGSDAIGNAYLKYAGLTINTLDLDDCLLMTATFTVKANAPAGEAFFGIAANEYCKGDDAQGASYTNIVSEVVEGGEKLTVSVG